MIETKLLATAALTAALAFSAAPAFASSSPTPTPTPSCGYADNCTAPTPKDAALVVQVTPPNCFSSGNAFFQDTVNATYLDEDYGNTRGDVPDDSSKTFTRRAVANPGHEFADGSETATITYTIQGKILPQSTNPNGECYAKPSSTPVASQSPVPVASATSTPVAAVSHGNGNAAGGQLAHTGINVSWQFGGLGVLALIAGFILYVIGRRKRA